MTNIKIKEVCFSSESLVDSFGRVFFYDNKVFRLINSHYKEECNQLLNSELFKELLSIGLVPNTFISDLNFEFKQDGLILEHEKILDTKPNEWSFGMYRDAAVLLLKVNEICNKYGSELKDAHPHNILFRSGKPVFIDIGSIQKKKQIRWFADTEFVKTFFLPLLLWSEGEYYLLRLITESDFYQRIIPSQNVFSSKVVQKYIGNLFVTELQISKYRIQVSTTLLNPIVRVINKIVRLFVRKKGYQLIKRNKKLRQINGDLIKKMKPYQQDSLWQNYHNEFFSENENLSYPRFDKIIDLIKEHCTNADTVIDLAGNQGVFSFLLEKTNQFHQLITTDYDENALEKAYLNINKFNSKVNPVLLNFMVPANLHSTTQRLSADIVIALAVTHHLVLTQGFSISAIFERLSLFSKKYVVVEFMPLGLWDGNENSVTTTPEWYNLEWFKSSFEDYFKLLTCEKVERNRIVFIGEKL